jgi:chromosome segregation ATPase
MQGSQHGLDAQFRVLQEQNRKLQGELQRIHALSEDQDDARQLREQLAETQAELEECRSQAIKSREELSTLSHELDNYVSVFEVMDRKVGEVEAERDVALRELAELRQKYFSHFS